MPRARTRVLTKSVVVALAAGLASTGVLAPYASATKSSTATQVRRPAVELTGTWVFSPNGDGRHDVARYTVALRKRAKVTVKVLDQDGAVVRGPVRLGEHRSGSTVRWTWDGRDHHGHRVADGYGYTVRAKATTYAGDVVTDDVWLAVDTVFDPQLGSNYDTVYPRSQAVTDRIWFGTRGTDDVNQGTLRIRTPGGKLVLRKPYFAADYPYLAAYPVAWNGRDADGHALPAGKYWARVVSTDRVGNRGITPRIPVYVSAARLVQATGTVDVTAADSQMPYNPCRNSTANGCGDFPPCGTVVPSTSYTEAGALSYRSDTACSPNLYQHFAVGSHKLPGPEDSARGTALVSLTMRGKPMNAGDPDVARIAGGSTSATTAPTGQETSTTIAPARVPTQALVRGGNASWEVSTTGTDAFDVASFRVTYNYLTTAP